MACPTLRKDARADCARVVRRLNPGSLLGRNCLLLLLALSLGTATGCTAFQTLDTAKWWDTSFLDPNNSGHASQILVFWDSQIRLTQDSVNGGRSLAGMAGKVYLMNQDTGKAVDATGRMVVQMHDMTNLQPGQVPRCIGEYNFDPKSLKRLKRLDAIAEGYVLFLPWEDYQPTVKKVQIRVAYVPDEKAPPFFAEPTLITLQTGDQPPPQIEGSRIAPISNLVPKR